MAWYYRSPTTFPVSLLEGMLEAAATPDTSIMIFRTDSHSDAVAKAELLRWLRWCVKQAPNDSAKLFSAVTNYKFRSAVKFVRDSVRPCWVVSIKAQPILGNILLDLNPHLSDVLAIECQ